MVDPIFKNNVQRQRHPGRCLVAESKRHSFEKARYVDQNKLPWT